jgi:hypothetical protein
VAPFATSYTSFHPGLLSFDSGRNHRANQCHISQTVSDLITTLVSQNGRNGRLYLSEL